MEATQKAQILRGGSGIPTRYAGEMGRLYALSGKRQEALRAIEAMKAQKTKGREANIALIYAALDDKDQAFRWLQMAVEQRELVVFLPADPKFDNLRSDPRWQTFLHAINYPQ